MKRLVIPAVPMAIRLPLGTIIITIAYALSTVSLWVGDLAEWIVPEFSGGRRHD